MVAPTHARGVCIGTVSQPYRPYAVVLSILQEASCSDHDVGKIESRSSGPHTLECVEQQTLQTYSCLDHGLNLGCLVQGNMQDLGGSSWPAGANNSTNRLSSLAPWPKRLGCMECCMVSRAVTFKATCRI